MLILQNGICISRYLPLKSFLEMSFLVVQKHLIRRLQKLAPIFGLNRNIFTWIFQKFAKIWDFTISHKNDFKCYDVLRRNIDFYGAHKRTLKGHFKIRVFLSNKVKVGLTKVGHVFSIVIVSILPHAEFGPNGHREDALRFNIGKFR